jgi:hypothetical protein
MPPALSATGVPLMSHRDADPAYIVRRNVHLLTM